MCGVLCYPQGSAARHVQDGSLKLRYDTTVFTKQFPTGHYQVWVEEMVIGELRPLVISWIVGGNFGKRVRLARKTRARSQSHLLIRIEGIQRRGDGKDCTLPSSEGEGGEVGRASQSFFSPWGWMSVCNWGSLETAFGGNRLRVPAGQSSRRRLVHG